jgi:predicted N-formylglutamate amidohydrolase
MMPAAAVCEMNRAGRSRILLLCDHATNVVPPDVAGGDLGLPPEEMARHIAWDIGAAGVTEALARLLDASALLTRFSRLVIDPNRGEDDPTLVMRLYDGTVVPANRAIRPAEIERRLNRFHRPYHRAVAAAIERLGAAGRAPALVAIHSFTPRLKGRPPRPWQVGILWHRDGRIALPLIARLRAEGLCVGDNEPYSGELEGDTMSRHGTRNGLPHVLIELRQDLIAAPADQRLWAERLAPILAQTIDEVPDG